MVGNALAGVADHSGLAVLYHYPSVAVIHIYDCPGVLRQAVEEQLLAAQVFGEALVVIQMVVREVGENAHVEVQGGRSLLLYPYGADLHEAVAAALLHHLGHQGVDRDRVGGGVYGLAALVVHIVCYGGKQAAAVPQCLEHPVEQGHGRSLAVCARDAHEGQLAGRIAVEVGRTYGQGLPVCRYHSRGALLQSRVNEIVSVHCAALHCYEQRAGNRFPGIGADGSDLAEGIPFHD